MVRIDWVMTFIRILLITVVVWLVLSIKSSAQTYLPFIRDDISRLTDSPVLRTEYDKEINGTISIMAPIVWEPATDIVTIDRFLHRVEQVQIIKGWDYAMDSDKKIYYYIFFMVRDEPYMIHLMTHERIIVLTHVPNERLVN